MSHIRTVAGGFALAAVIMLHACYTEPTPVKAPTRSVSERFEASWQAAHGAAADVGVKLTSEDRSSGTLLGNVGSSSVAITVVTQADSSIHVGFSVTGGPSAQDANIKDHLTRAYQRRMGR